MADTADPDVVHLSSKEQQHQQQQQEEPDMIEKVEVHDSSSSEPDISPEHRQYLLNRHGTLDLDPLPSMDPADPHNWPSWKKISNLILVAFHACMSTFTAACIIPAYEDIALDLNISIQRTSYLTSLQIAVLGAAPLFWRPLSQRYGRRPLFLLSLVGSGVCNIGCAKSHSYASMAACRTLVAFFISPAIAIGSGVVMETFFKRQRARYMGIWTVMVTLGVPLGPFIFGFVAQRVGYRWIYWVLAIINLCQFILYLFLGPETRYLGPFSPSSGSSSSFRAEYISIRRIDPTPLSFKEIVYPLRLIGNVPVLIVTVAYSMVFLFASVLGSVEVPQLLQIKFGLNAQQLGLQFLGLVIGSVLGEQMGGYLSDTWMNIRTKQLGGKRPTPEFRLWLSYVGYVLTIVGMVVFLVCTQTATEGQWTVSPVVGLGVAAFGNQVVTTVLTTYAVDVHPEDAASVGVFVNFVRSEWGFIGPFWFSHMFDSVGVAASSGVIAALIVGVSLNPTAILHVARGRFRHGLK